jgi:hypothetical protein
MQKARSGLSQFWNSIWSSGSQEPTIPLSLGLIAVAAMFVFIISLQWAWGILSVAVALFALFVAFIYGKTVGHLIEETFYRFARNESRLTDSSLLWGWAGVAAGVIAVLIAPRDAALTMQVVNLIVVTAIVWGVLAFPMLVFRLNNEPKEPTEH